MTAHGACSAQHSDGFWSSLAMGWKDLLHHWREEREISEAEEALAALDDRLLKDIGIARDDIHFMVRARRR
jgi:uncharacterized protein YjiS (DUF1127 family)